jgi:hypothetical protein
MFIELFFTGVERWDAELQTVFAGVSEDAKSSYA